MTHATRLSDYRDLVFHVGVYKTGSSHLQALCLANRAALAARSIHLPLYRDPAEAARRGANHGAAVVRMAGRGLWAGLSDDLDLSSPHRTLLLTAEDFLRPGRLGHVLRRLRVEAPATPARFIAYLRRYDELLESAYAQAVKHREHGPLVADAQGIRFHADLPAIRAELGAEALILRPYVARHWPGAALGQDFTAALGWHGLWDEMTEGRALRQNARLSRVHTHLLSRLTEVADKRALLDYFPDHPPPGAEADTSRYFLSPQARRKLNQDGLRQDRALFQSLGIDDPAGFLDLDSFPDVDSWVPFRPDQAALDAYLQNFAAWKGQQTGALAQLETPPNVAKGIESRSNSPGIRARILNKFKLGGKKS